MNLKSLVIFGAVAMAVTAQSAHAQDAAAGEKVFKKCAACHQVGPDAKNKLGPHLNNLFGRPAAGLEDYKYSKAMQNSEIVWDEETVTTFLEKPKKMIKGTKMTFSGLKKEKDLTAIIIYLQQFSE